MSISSKTYLKNKIIFKSLFENISPINKVWSIHPSKFDLKNVFEDESEKKFYFLVKKFFDSQAFLDYDNSNYYNLFRMEIEKSANSKKQMEEFIGLLNEIQSIEISKDEIPIYQKNIEMYIKSVATYYAFQNSIEIYEKTKGKSYQDSQNDFFNIFDTMEQAIKLNITDGDSLGWDFSNLDSDVLKLAFEEKIRIPFSKSFHTLQDITVGGIPLKTVNVILGASHVGKTRMLLNLAMDYFMNGINVSYISLEISQEDILARSLSHLLHKPLKELSLKTTKELFKEYQNLRQKNPHWGNLFIKEFPTGEFTPRDFEQYLDSFKTKEIDDRPTIYLIDYLQIMGTMSNNYQGSYYSLKENIEKLRGVAQKNEVAVWSAGQLKRESHNRLGNDLDDIGESWAIIQTADLVAILEENDAFKEYEVQILRVRKNRNGKPFDDPIFLELEDSWLFNLREVSDPQDLERFYELYKKMSGKDKFSF